VLRPIPLTIAFTVLLVTGLLHGLWTERWTSSQALDTAVVRLRHVSANVGPWSSVNVEVDAEAFRQARAVGYWMRRYSKPGFAGSITVILMCGRTGHMAVHTPDVCYRGAGYESSGELSPETIALPGGKQAEVRTAVFRQPGKVGEQPLRIYWSWSSDGHWKAPASPRWIFGGSPYLFKLYVVCEEAEGPASAGVEFLQRLLPQLERSLFASNESNAEL
jgi:hypothetical protein